MNVICYYGTGFVTQSEYYLHPFWGSTRTSMQIHRLPTSHDSLTLPLPQRHAPAFAFDIPTRTVPVTGATQTHLVTALRRDFLLSPCSDACRHHATSGTNTVCAAQAYISFHQIRDDPLSRTLSNTLPRLRTSHQPSFPSAPSPPPAPALFPPRFLSPHSLPTARVFLRAIQQAHNTADSSDTPVPP